MKKKVFVALWIALRVASSWLMVGCVGFLVLGAAVYRASSSIRNIEYSKDTRVKSFKGLLEGRHNGMIGKYAILAEISKRA